MKVIDLHTHVIWGVDDGPETLEESLDLLRRLEAAGTRVCVATPHYNPPLYTFEEVPGRFIELADAAGEAGLGLELVLGAEVALHQTIREEVEAGSLRALGKSRTVLLEMPPHPLPPRFREFVFSLSSRGLKPLLAHPERCPSLAGDLPALLALRESGALVQVTAGALLGDFGRAVRKVVRTLLRKDMVDVIASDVHGLLGRSGDLPKAAAEAARWCGSSDKAQAMITSTPARLLSMEE